MKEARSFLFLSLYLSNIIQKSFSNSFIININHCQKNFRLKIVINIFF